MAERRTPGLSPILALAVVAGIALASAFIVGSAAMRWLDEEVGGSCSDQHDTTYPLGFCAPVLRGGDFADGRATLAPRWTREAGWPQISYTFQNNTQSPRSFDWRLVTAIGPDGDTTECWGDDSAYRYQAPPLKAVDSYGGCAIKNPTTGQYRLFYDNVAVALIDAPQ